MPFPNFLYNSSISLETWKSSPGFIPLFSSKSESGAINSLSSGISISSSRLIIFSYKLASSSSLDSKAAVILLCVSKVFCLISFLWEFLASNKSLRMHSNSAIPRSWTSKKPWIKVESWFKFTMLFISFLLSLN